MTINRQLSAAITGLDATPQVRPTEGKGGVGRVKVIDGAVSVTASGEQYSSVRIARVRSTDVLKSIEVYVGASLGTTGNFDIGAVYADTVLDATNSNAISANAFGDVAIDAGGQGASCRSVPGVLFKHIGATASHAANSVWTAAEANVPLWEALGLSSDPGRLIDICLLATDEAIGATGGPVYFRVELAD